MKHFLVLMICFVFASLVAGDGYGRSRVFRRRRIGPHIRPVSHVGSIIQTRPAIHPKPIIQTKPVSHVGSVIQTRPAIHPKPIIQTKPVIHPKPHTPTKKTVIHHPKPAIQPKPVIKPASVVHPKPVHPKPVHHTPVHHTPVHHTPIQPIPVHNPITALSGGGIPPDVAAVIGTTITGERIAGGMNGFPAHGGTLNEEGLMNGWGADPSVQANSAVTGWTDPWDGRGYPVDYEGQNPEDLIFDPVNNRYVWKHQQAKDTQFLTVTNGGLIVDDTSRHVEHKIVKDANIMANQAIQGISPVGQHVESKLIGQQIHNNAKAQGHSIAKSSGVIKAGRPSYLGHKETGTINAGLIGHTPPEVIAQNIGIATLGADAMRGHAIAQSFGPPQGVAFINPSGPVAAQLGVNQVVHDTAKASSFGVIGKQDQHIGLADPGLVGHNVGIKSGVGIIPNRNVVSPIAHHIGGAGIQTHPVDTVHNVIKSGVATAGHDPLAANIGSAIANRVIEEASNVVDMGSNGGVSFGNPIAVAATHGLAQNTGHIVGKILNVASQSNPIQPNGPIAVGKDIFGHGPAQPVVHKPAVKKPLTKTLSGYGRRRY